MSSGVNLSYGVNHSRHRGTVRSVATTGGTIPLAHPREGPGRNVIITWRIRFRHNRVTRRGARDRARLPYRTYWHALTLRPTKYDAQGRDGTTTPRRRIWTMVDEGLQLTKLTDPTGRADDLNRRG
jgi:hypothetical protein